VEWKILLGRMITKWGQVARVQMVRRIKGNSERRGGYAAYTLHKRVRERKEGRGGIGQGLMRLTTHSGC